MGYIRQQPTQRFGGAHKADQPYDKSRAELLVLLGNMFVDTRAVQEKLQREFRSAVIKV